MDVDGDDDRVYNGRGEMNRISGILYFLERKYGKTIRICLQGNW